MTVEQLRKDVQALAEEELGELAPVPLSQSVERWRRGVEKHRRAITPTETR